MGEIQEEEEETTTLSIWSASLVPLNKGFLANISAIIQPTDHMSTAVEYFFAPSSSSGAL